MAESSNAHLTHLVDDFYFSVLSHGGNDADHDDALFPISDEEYASELQLQEVLLSSAIASASRAPPSAKISEHAATKTFAIGECSGAPAASEDVLFCKICMEAVPAAEARQASRGCPHAFCGACLARYVGAKIQERVADVGCPEERCASVLDPELCQAFLPREVFDRWGAALCESMVLGARGTYCPFKDCSAMMVAEDGDVGCDGVTQSECPNCRRLFCARCAVPWHAGVSCAEFSQLGEGERAREDLMLMELAKGEKWRRCPRCTYFVEKSDGCLHITCRCSYEFCYGCGEQWAASHTRCDTA